MMLLALMFTLLGSTAAMGQKIYHAELDKSMFTAWDGTGADAQQTEPQSYIGKEGATVDFACEMNLYKSLGAGSLVFGNTNVYSRWYANLTGTQKITFKGTAGVQLRVLMNRPDAEEGAADPNGGATVEKNVTIGENGEVTLDVTDLEYVHLNAIKTGWGSPTGNINGIELVGTVKPVTGVLSMINNGDAEGDDLSSFPVSWDGPNNGGSAPDQPEIVEGGVNGSKCFKVVSFSDPTETWHTQFYIKADEVMPKGSKFKLSMWIKADKQSNITTSAQAAPRTWKGGFVDAFTVGTEWKEYTWSGEIGVDDFQSIAIDLNNSDERNADDNGWTPGNGNVAYYFDNIEFGYDLGGSNPMSLVSGTFGADVIQIDLSNTTNMADLVKAADGKKVIYPNDCVTVTWNGKPANPISVEGRPNGNFYIFLNDIDGDDILNHVDETDAEVVVAFKNPADEALHLAFTTGKWEGEAVPDFSGLVCAYDESLESGEFESYLYKGANLLSADPEDGSFNLDPTLNQFTLTFDQKMDVTTVKATLDKEALTATIDDTKTIVTLTRTGSGDLSGTHTLYVDQANTERDYELEQPFTLTYSFGPTVIDENDQPETLYASNFTNDGDDAQGAGWIVTADINEQNPDPSMQPANSGAGNRLQHGKAGFAADVLYLAQRSAQAGIALYGTEEDHKLTLKGGKTYHLTLKTAQWDAYNASDDPNRTLRAQILTEDAVSTDDGTIVDEDGIIAEDFQLTYGHMNDANGISADKEYTAFDIPFTPEADGNFVIRLVAGNKDGNPAGYNDGNAIGDVKVEYIPNVMGIVEIKALEAALETAKAALDENNDERYAGAAYTALDNLVKEYDGKTMTAPSAYNKATTDLAAATKALNEHVKLCQDYDALPEQAFNLYMQYKDSKYNVTEYFDQLKAAVQKYCVLGTEEIEDEETGEKITNEVMESFKLFYDDAELTAAKNELSSVIDMVKKMFSEGKSHNWYGGGDRTAGFAALHERLRRGVALLQSLGIDEDAPEIVAANAELGDNDEIAEAIMKRATTLILADLASDDSQLFAMAEDAEDAPTYDLGVFMKNPNIYSPANSTELPGWTSVRGNCFVFPGWGAEHTESTPYAEDCQIHAGWHPSGLPMVEQTIENLPAGVYTIHIDGSDNNSEVSENTFGFVKTSETPALEEEEELDPDVHFAGYVACSGDIEGIEVTDGKLTVGFCYGPGSQAFINDVEITLTAPVEGFDYAKAYKDIVDLVETAKTAKVRAIEMYDLNGRRVSSARKGLVIVKKMMSDGTVKTTKVVK